MACIVHTYSLAGCAVSAMECGLIPLDQQSMMFHNRVAYHDLEGIATDIGEQERLVADLGDMNALILRNHGILTVGRSVGEAFRRLYYLERACKLQVQAMQSGTKLVIPSDDGRRTHRPAMGSGRSQPGNGQPDRMACTWCVTWNGKTRVSRRKSPVSGLAARSSRGRWTGQYGYPAAAEAKATFGRIVRRAGKETVTVVPAPGFALHRHFAFMQ